VILYLYMPEDKGGYAKLLISRIVHGYKDLYAGLSDSIQGFGDSGDCQEDVACYPGWGNESDAVAMVLLANGDSLCSGSLLNNAAQDYRGYFLTAFHCIDTDKNGSLSTTEKNNAQEWAFKFNYNATSCGGSQVATTTTYNHDNFRAAWYTTDFALVELEDDLTENMCLSFLGWDRSGNVPTEGTTIHHPSADVMKISFDEDQLIETSKGENSGDYFWKVDWDIGATENVSSGAPLFDQNKRVVGQLAGGESECGGDDMRDWYGCFYRSWTGGGTSSTRLADWLGFGYTTLNTIRPEGIITGPWQVCSDDVDFTLQNAPEGSSVTWTAAYVTPSSETGTTATFHSTCTEAALGCVTFTVSNLCGGTASTTVSKTFMSAGPHPDSCKLYVTYSTGEPAPKPAGQYLLCPYTYYYFYVNNTSDCSTSDYDWTLPPSITLAYTYNNMACVYTGYNPGGNVIVKANTCCECEDEVKILSDYVGTYYNCGYRYMSFTPNPTADETIMELETNNIENYSEENEWGLEIFNQQLILMHKTSRLKNKKYTISTSGWQEGIYYVRVIIKDKVLFGKFVVSR